MLNNVKDWKEKFRFSQGLYSVGVSKATTMLEPIQIIKEKVEHTDS